MISWYVKGMENGAVNPEDWHLAEQIMACLKENATGNIWSNGDEILCKTEAQAEAIADLLEACGYDYVRTGFYDPEEDAKEGRTFDTTGWWYVDWD